MIHLLRTGLTLTILSLICAFSQAQTTTQLLLAQGNFSEAIALLEPKASTLDQNQSYHLAIAYQQSGYHKKAIDCLLKYSDSLTNQQLDLLCRCYIVAGDYGKALPICESRYKENPTDKGNIMRYAEINMYYKEYETNIKILNSYISEDSLNYNINLQLAETYQKAKCYELATSVYKMILRQYPDNQKIALKLGRLFYNRKQYVECHDLCVPFIHKLDNNKNFLLLAGSANFKNGSNRNVLIMFNHLEAGGDSSFLTKKYLGITYYRLESFDKAIKQLHAAMCYNDDDPEVAFFLGSSYGQTTQALRGKMYLDAAREIIKPSPALMEKINYKTALICFDTGNYPEAIRYFQEAHKYAPDNAQYLYEQATIYDYRIKDPKQAARLYNEFLNALPDELDSKKGNELYAIKLKEVVSKRLIVLKEEDFFKNGI